MFKQMSKYSEPFCSKFQCGFRKRFSAQQCFLSMSEKQKSIADNQKRFGALLTNLSEAFDCLSHDLLITMLNAYGLTINSLRLKQDYLTNHKQRTRKNSAYSSWEEIFFRVPQGSVTGLLTFNIFFMWFIFHYGGRCFCNLCR